MWKYSKMLSLKKNTGQKSAPYDIECQDNRKVSDRLDNQKVSGELPAEAKSQTNCVEK